MEQLETFSNIYQFILIMVFLIVFNVVRFFHLYRSKSGEDKNIDGAKVGPRTSIDVINSGGSNIFPVAGINSVRRGSWDLVLISLLSLALALFLYISPESPARLVLGLPFILFFPGHALTSALFPERDAVDGIERVALAIVLSIAVVPLIGFVLNYTPFGIRLEPLLWSLIAFDLAFSAVGVIRRRRAADPFLPPGPGRGRWPSMKEGTGGSKLNRALTAFLVISMFSSVCALAYVAAVPRDGERFTEFYILGPGGDTSAYPSELAVGETGAIIVGIANHEHRTVSYNVEVWLSNSTSSDGNMTLNRLYYYGSISVTLDHVDADTSGDWVAQWETAYDFSIPFTGQYKLWFILLLDEDPFSGTTMVDLVNTEAGTRFVDLIDNEGGYVLALNIDVA